jgi:hypothetical protein
MISYDANLECIEKYFNTVLRKGGGKGRGKRGRKGERERERENSNSQYVPSANDKSH